MIGLPRRAPIVFGAIVSAVIVVLAIVDTASANHAPIGAADTSAGNIWTYGGQGTDPDCFEGDDPATDSTPYAVRLNCLVLAQGVQWAEQRRFGQAATANGHLNTLAADLASVKSSTAATETALGDLMETQEAVYEGERTTSAEMLVRIYDEQLVQTSVLEQLRDQLADGVVVRAADDEPVLVADEKAHETAEQSYSGLNGAVWWIGGLLVSMFLLYVIYRQVMPRA